MSTILDTIADYAKIRVAEAQKQVSLEEMKRQALALPKGKFEFETVLQSSGISFICECKKASPSKGIIAEKFDYVTIAKEYEAAGASCISVLTEPKWFLGRNEYLKEISAAVSVPCLRKDFVVDEYMIYEAKVLGAKAVLLICSILEQEQMRHYIQICNQLGITALVEAHTAEEVSMAIDCESRVIGVNNRNLKDFSVNSSNCLRLRDNVPKEILFVAESGIHTPQDMRALYQNGVNAVLIGEAVMKAENKKEFLASLGCGKEVL
ncbi:MAG: indole-3-glycerol phosphate synthase TrpC [Lachnospiraceae bacterium]